MSEFEVGGIRHRTRRLSAYDQFHLLRAVADVLPAIEGIGGGSAGGVRRAIAALGALDDEVVSASYDACLAACESEMEGVWMPPSRAGGLHGMVLVITCVVGENFGAMLALDRPEFRRTASSLDFEPVAMPNGTDWLWRTCDPPTSISFTGLFDGTVRIEHVAIANDVLDVRGENEARARKAADRK